MLLFLTTKQTEELQPFKSTDLLPSANLLLGNYLSSKELSVTKNNKQELEFYNETPRNQAGLSYLDFILNPSTNYVVHVKLEY